MRFPFFRPGGFFRPDPYQNHDHPDPRHTASGVGGACVNRVSGCITTIIIVAVLIYLFSANPPWFQQIRDNIVNAFDFVQH
jgi:hypothetical protein